MDHPAELEFAWLMFTGILLMFLLAMSLVLFFVYYQRRLFRQQAELEKQKLEEQKKLLQAEIAAQENERARIARDLHDEVGAQLSAIKLHVTAPQTDAAASGKRSSMVAAMLDDAVQKLRSIAQNLIPQNLERFGLIPAIEYHFHRFESSGLFEIHFQHNLTERLELDKELLLFRIVQELLNNTVKHAQASLVTLTLQQQNGSTQLHYRDNGVGFLPTKTGDQNGLGLSTLNSRVQLLKGTMLYRSEPGAGVQVSITF